MFTAGAVPFWTRVAAAAGNRTTWLLGLLLSAGVFACFAFVEVGAAIAMSAVAGLAGAAGACGMTIGPALVSKSMRPWS